MIKRQKVESLCHKHTNLTKEDIEKLYEVIKNLQIIADLSKANIFVDCPTIEGRHAIVVAEASPSTAKSVYKEPVVGKMAYEAFEPAVFFTLRTGKHMFLNRAITQEGKAVEQSVVPIKGLNDKVIGALIMEKDISEKLQYQNELKAFSKTTETLSEILIGLTENRPIIPEVMDEALFFVEPHNGNLLYYNPAAMNLVSEVCNLECKVDTLIKDYFHCVEDIIFAPEEVLMKEVIISKKVFEVKKLNLKKDGELNGILLIFRDLTELREKERELIVKSVAIREIHHRVKNNLQTVASLLRLQMKSVPVESKSYFLESLNRILSISSVYEIILSSSNVDEVDIYSLIKKIGDMLVYSEVNEDKSIGITYKGTKLLIHSQAAVTVALVINELIQNCIKHAFKGLQGGEIEVIFEHRNNIVQFQVNDNGIGYLPSSEPSIGLNIVKMLIEHDLSGQFEIERTDKGTSVHVKFLLDKED
ncbi:histidine kinase [Pueribacillus theae]|uniref:histidine kinase n=1 Tax=Pueribacillus theae TaxID=2171751 RepID=A0A2U1K768_9BACI|nr:sensor histidine kinase [Pueribacillus theae]PWA13064.1 histidine kinase [Pueribacillus theae]